MNSDEDPIAFVIFPAPAESKLGINSSKLIDEVKMLFNLSLLFIVLLYSVVKVHLFETKKTAEGAVR
jgi:hypothetical protein